MALTYDQATTVSKAYFDDTIKQQVYEDSYLFAWLKKNNRITVSGGKSIRVPIRYKKLDLAEACNPRSQFVFQSVDTRTAIDLDWKYYRDLTLLHWDEKVQNAGEGEIIDIMRDKADEMKEDLQDLLYSDLFATSAGSLSFTPLSTIVDSAASYGGVAVSDAAAWASTEDNSTTKLLAYGSGSISYMVSQATFGKNAPTVHITTRELADAFEAVLQPQQRYTSEEAASLGFPETIAFRKVPVVGDAFCPTGYWYGLDLNQFEFFVKEGENMDLSDWFPLEQAGFPKSMGRYGTFVANLVCRMRKSSFKYTALDYTA